VATRFEFLGPLFESDGTEVGEGEEAYAETEPETESEYSSSRDV